jgi:PEP-CTERM motif-containing protein
VRRQIDRMRFWTLVAVGVSGVLATGSARATMLAGNLVVVSTPDGSVSLHSQVDDNVAGDTSRWLFSYVLGGTFDPIPGTTNGLSSLQLFFGGPVPDVTDQTAPASWILNELVEPPFGVGFDLPNSAGFGAGPNGSATFSFAVPAGTAFTDDGTLGSLAASHSLDVAFGAVALVDGGHGPIVPVPEPASLLLVGGGLALLARRRLSSPA